MTGSGPRPDPTLARRARALGQSLWYDNISRSLLDSGEIARWIEGDVVTGITTNPTIFQKALSSSAAYEPAIDALLEAGASDTESIYHSLSMADVREAADLLRPVYDRSAGVDGYVSLEVLPSLAHDSQSTVAEAKRLFRELGRPNVMIKVPGTEEGTEAFRRLTAEGVNVNVTLLFSLGQYEAVAKAYLAGLEEFRGKGGDVSKVASVASFFVSRVDSAVDAWLDGKGGKDALGLRGRIGIANCKAVYQSFQGLFGAPFAALRKAGGRPQRVLWASTGTKNPAYPDTLYVDTLLGADTVNTLPPATLEAFLDHGTADASTITQDVASAQRELSALARLGLDLDVVCAKLERDGVAAFSKSFDELLASLEAAVASRRTRTSG